MISRKIVQIKKCEELFFEIYLNCSYFKNIKVSQIFILLKYSLYYFIFKCKGICCLPVCVTCVCACKCTVFLWLWIKRIDYHKKGSIMIKLNVSSSYHSLLVWWFVLYLLGIPFLAVKLFWCHELPTSVPENKSGDLLDLQ